MDRHRSGVFDLKGLRIGSGGDSMNHPSLPGTKGQGERYHTKSLPISDMKPSEPKKPTHVVRNAAGEETPVYGLQDPKAKSVTGKKGYSVSEIGSGKVIKKEHESVAASVAAELSEAWWCGTPDMKKKGAPPKFRTNQPDKIALYSLNSVDKPVTEAVKERKAPKTKATKPSKVPDAKNEDPAMAHAKKIMKMANCVAGSVHASPLGILAAEYAKHTFHPSNIGEEVIDERHQTQAYKHHYKDRSVHNDGPRDNTDPNNIKDQHKGLVTMNVAKDGPFPIKTAKGNYKDDSSRQRANKPGGYIDKQFPNEAAEAIVDKFLEDTMTGDVASMALGFAPTGEMDPHEGRPGKKKKKKSQFKELEREVSGGDYHKLTRKVAGNMSGV